MRLLRKWNMNECHWLHTYQIYTVWKSRAEISYTLMVISLGLGFYWFVLQRNVDQFNSIFFIKCFFTQPVTYEFLWFFLCGQLYRFRDILQTSELTSTTEPILARTWFFILMDSAIVCIHFGNSQVPISLNIAAVQEHVGHYTNKFTKAGLDFFVKYLFVKYLMRILLPRMHFLLLLSLVVVAMLLVVVVTVIALHSSW